MAPRRMALRHGLAASLRALGELRRLVSVGLAHRRLFCAGPTARRARTRQRAGSLHALGRSGTGGARSRLPAQSPRLARLRADSGTEVACPPGNVAGTAGDGAGLVAFSWKLLGELRPEPGGIGILSAPGIEPAVVLADGPATALAVALAVARAGAAERAAGSGDPVLRDAGRGGRCLELAGVFRGAARRLRGVGAPILAPRSLGPARPDRCFGTGFLAVRLAGMVATAPLRAAALGHRAAPRACPERSDMPALAARGQVRCRRQGAAPVARDGPRLRLALRGGKGDSG